MPVDNSIQKKPIETRLRESEARYRVLTENYEDMIACLDVEGRYLYVSPASVTLFGQTEDQLLGRPAIDFAHPDDVSLLLEAIRQIVAIPGAATVTFRRLCADGRYVWVESKVRGMREADNTVSQIILATRDITERRRAEEDHRITACAFEAQGAMVVTDTDGVILRVNQAFCQITGYSAAEAVGRRTNLLKSGRHDQAFFETLWTAIREVGKWRGEIWNRRKDGEVYLEWLTITAIKGRAGEITHYVGAFTDLTRHQATDSEIEHLAFYDPLTRLANARLLKDRLHKALASSSRSRRKGALLHIDLDNVGTVNDTLGFDKGDHLLQKAAERLFACVRETDTVARLGSDEFAVMLEDLSEDGTEAAAQARVVGEKILAALSDPCTLGDAEYAGSASIGITLFGDCGDSPDGILKLADRAMRRAKMAGRNAMHFFDPDMQAALAIRVMLEADLQAAIRDSQFVLHYQPQVDSKGRSTGAEALVRWQHPERGLVFPDRFISLSEQTGLILPLGSWVLETACRQLVAWAARRETSHLTLAVNVSAYQFRQADFVDQVVATLDRTGADPRKLKLELTESMLLDDIDVTIDKMTKLRASGLTFSLDDFGTGYSSLAYLKSLPLSQLKIDRSFVSDVQTNPNAAAIVRTIVFLAQSLNLMVIAEGVETEGQRDFLDRSGCRDFQGYLFSRPLPLAEFEVFLARRARGSIADSAEHPLVPFIAEMPRRAGNG